ncbi:hypothetical protein KQI84_18775 [bacterium]|nr:hypothetical protein [bacterium]
MPQGNRIGLGVVAGVLATVIVVLVTLELLLNRPEEPRVLATPEATPQQVQRPGSATSSNDIPETSPTPVSEDSQLAGDATPLPESGEMSGTGTDESPAEATEEPPALTIHVFSSSGEPAPGARVWVLPAKSFVQDDEQILPADTTGGIDLFAGMGSGERRHLPADESGIVSIPLDQPPGEYIAAAIGADNGAGQSEVFELFNPAVDTSIDVILDPPGQLIGSVLNSDGEPIPMERVQISGNALEIEEGGKTVPALSPSIRVVLQPTILFEAATQSSQVGENGSYSADSIPPIAYLAKVSGEFPEGWAGPADRVIDRDALLEIPAEENFILTRASALLGLIENSEGEPIRRARVTWQAKPEGGGPLVRGGSMVTDYDGVFIFENVPFQPIVLEVGHLNYRTNTVEIGYPDQTDLVVQLEPLPAVEGYVVNAESRDPVEGATVRIEPLPGSDALPRAGGSLKTNAVGWFSFQVSGSGGVLLRAEKKDAGLVGELRVDEIADYRDSEQELTIEVHSAPSLLLRVAVEDESMRLPRRVTYTMMDGKKPSRIGIAELKDNSAEILVEGLKADRIQISVQGGRMFGEAPLKLPGQQAVSVLMKSTATPTPEPQ